MIFDRPVLTARVLQAIRAAQTRLLLVIADGPRLDRPGEVESCAATRALLKTVDWPCEVRADFSSVNLGCRRRISSGLNWVFQQVQEAIILEDDCLPHPSFFSFCSQMLERYRHDPRIMMISGGNFQPAEWTCRHSYYFSRYAHVLGWATWARAWRAYDADMTDWPTFRRTRRFAAMFSSRSERRFWVRTFEALYRRQVDTWDGQWAFAIRRQGGLAIVPTVNLISNIGSGKDGTHYDPDSSTTDRSVAGTGILQHPSTVEPDMVADEWELRHIIMGPGFRCRNRWHRRLARAPRYLFRAMVESFDLLWK